MWGGKQLFAFIGGSTAGVAENLQSGAVIHTWTIPFRCRPIRCGFTITIAVTTNSAILKFNVVNRTVAAVAQTTTTGGAGILTIPVSTEGIGKAYYQNTDYADSGTVVWNAYLEEGDLVAATVTTTAAAGSGIPWLIVEVDPEQPANNSSMIESA